MISRTSTQDPPRTARPLPTWVILVVPLVTFVLASTDAFLLAVPRVDSKLSNWKLALVTTVPLSATACALTFWILIRLRNEIDRRASSEDRLRTALGERDVAIAELSQGLEREQRLRRELDHRVRNNLSSLLGLVGLYEGSRVDSGDLVRSLRGRISALREVYGLISAAPDEGVLLRDLVSKIAELTPRSSERTAIRVSGSTIRLPGREANALAMVVQELFTNAINHGALRSAGGEIEIRWTIEPLRRGTRLDLRWIESKVDGAGAQAERGKGLGLALIDGIVRSDLRGRASFDDSDGHWSVGITANLGEPAILNQATKQQEVCTP
jgi:two-component sensor histidine kinase